MSRGQKIALGLAAAGLVLTLGTANLPGHPVVDGNGRPLIYLHGYPTWWTFSEPSPAADTPDAIQDIVQTFLPHAGLRFVYDLLVWSLVSALFFVTGLMAARVVRKRLGSAETST